MAKKSVHQVKIVWFVNGELYAYVIELETNAKNKQRLIELQTFVEKNLIRNLRDQIFWFKKGKLSLIHKMLIYSCVLNNSTQDF